MAHTIQHQIITRALELISEETNWTRGALARNRSGLACSWDDAEAYRYCAIGALARAVADLFGPSREVGSTAIRAASHVLMANGLVGASLPSINDVRGHAAVVGMFKKALGH
jgi:hypothetical protein